MKPISAKCYVNGNIAEGEQKLNQGDIIQFGDCLKFRFNNPKEAELLIEKRRSGNFSLAVCNAHFNIPVKSLPVLKPFCFVERFFLSCMFVQNA